MNKEKRLAISALKSWLAFFVLASIPPICGLLNIWHDAIFYASALLAIPFLMVIMNQIFSVFVDVLNGKYGSPIFEKVISILLFGPFATIYFGITKNKEKVK